VQSGFRRRCGRYRGDRPTGIAASVAAVVAPHVKRVVIANPKQVRIIAYAKIKTGTIDAGLLARLYASGFLLEVWYEPTQALRRQVQDATRSSDSGRD
jgi:hypothetical protein